MFVKILTVLSKLVSLLIVTILLLNIAPVYAEKDNSLYLYVMGIYNDEYLDYNINKLKLFELKEEYDIASHSNLQAASFSYIKEYASQLEQEVNIRINDEISVLQTSRDTTALEVENNLRTLTIKELSSLNRQYQKHQEDINTLLIEKNSVRSIMKPFETEYYTEIDTSLIESSIKEQEDLLKYALLEEDNNMGDIDLLKIPFNVPKSVTSNSGYRTDPFDGSVKYHNATDYRMPIGTELYSLFNGTVTRSDNIGDSYGENIKIDCGNGFVIHYAHLSKRLVNVGDNITQNQLIGYSGNTGRSTGPHLHLSLFYKGEVLDIERLLNNDI